MIGKRLKELRIAAELTQLQVAERFAISKNSVSEWESDKSTPGIDKLPVLARLYKSTIEYILTGKGKFEGSNVIPADMGTKKIPLINYVQAGMWKEICDNFVVDENTPYLLTDADFTSLFPFAVEIAGRSMEPEFNAGDRVIIDPDVYPNPGDFVVAKNGKNEATFKKYRPRGINEHGEQIFDLVPLNEDFPTLKSANEPITIIGTMIEHRKYRRR